MKIIITISIVMECSQIQISVQCPPGPDIAFSIYFQASVSLVNCFIGTCLSSA